MRPGQNKRIRGRNNNNAGGGGGNRKGPNPLTRSYESNGPDVKIRGTAHHVAEKYLQLARDAQTSGDPVMAESYLQHAEHYFRIIAAAQQAQQQAQAGYVRQVGEVEAEEEDDDEGGIPDRFASPIERAPQPVQQPYQPQPYAPPPQPYAPQPGFQPQQGQPQGERQQGGERQDRQQERQQDRQDRGPRPDRPFQDRNNQQNRQGPNPNRGPRPQRDFRNDQQPRFEPRQAPIQDQPDTGLPAFITAPVRIPVSDNDAPQPALQGEAPENGPEMVQDEGVGFHLRPRRRRRRPGAEGEGETAGAPRGELPALD